MLGKSDTAGALGIVFKMLERGENMTGPIVQMTHYFGKLCRITSYNVCYTKLLR